MRVVFLAVVLAASGAPAPPTASPLAWLAVTNGDSPFAGDGGS